MLVNVGRTDTLLAILVMNMELCAIELVGDAATDFAIEGFIWLWWSELTRDDGTLVIHRCS